MLKYIKSIQLSTTKMVFDVRLFKTVSTNTVTDVRFDVVPFVNCGIYEAVFKQYLVCAVLSVHSV